MCLKLMRGNIAVYLASFTLSPSVVRCRTLTSLHKIRESTWLLNMHVLICIDHIWSMQISMWLLNMHVLICIDHIWLCMGVLKAGNEVCSHPHFSRLRCDSSRRIACSPVYAEFDRSEKGVNILVVRTFCLFVVNEI